jgi:hypothetical protein
MDVQHHPFPETKVIVYGPSKREDRELKEVERHARRQRLRIWGDSEPTILVPFYASDHK